MNDMNDDDDELGKASKLMQASMKQLPEHLTATYFEAIMKVPDLVAQESDPRWFLR